VSTNSLQYKLYGPDTARQPALDSPDPKMLFQFRFVRNRQLLTTLRATAGQDLTAIGSLHALTKAMHALAATSMWLKCTFHLKVFLRYRKFHQRLRVTIPVAGEREGKIREKKAASKQNYRNIRIAGPY
jgi:hypothetical protein